MFFYYPWSIWYLLKPKKSPLNPRDYPSQSKTRENGPSSSCIQNRRDNTRIKKVQEKRFCTCKCAASLHTKTKKDNFFFIHNKKKLPTKTSLQMCETVNQRFETFYNGRIDIHIHNYFWWFYSLQTKFLKLGKFPMFVNK